MTAATKAAATHGTLLDQVRPESAVDLGDERWLERARAKRARAVYTEAVQVEVARLVRRIGWLTGKAARLPVVRKSGGQLALSNGRAKAELEAARLQALALVLPQALSGLPVAKHPVVGGRHEQRAIRLLNEIADAA